MSSRKRCLDLTKELNHYLAKKETEIRTKLREGPPSTDYSNFQPASKLLVNFFGNIVALIQFQLNTNHNFFF